MNYFIDALKKYADFNGRASRQEYWMFFLVYIILYVVANIIDSIIGLALFSTVFSLAMLVPGLSIAARRLHDTGRSGWMQLIGIIPIVGWIIMIVFLTQDSHDDNDYGVNPKAGDAVKADEAA